MLHWLADRRRRKLAEQPTPPEWLRWLDDDIPAWRRLCADDQERFVALLKVFVAEKDFVGAGGLLVTERMKVLVSACAVRLVLHKGIEHYDHLTEVVLYPHEVLVDPRTGDKLLGAAHRHGSVVLSWPAVQQGLSRPADGHDTALHEFAHSLDLEDGDFDGTPDLPWERYRPWAHVLGHFHEQVQEGGDLLRDYAGHREGFVFTLSRNGVWLTDAVPPAYLSIPEDPTRS